MNQSSPWAIPVRLQQVFGNILHNASKYTAVGGTISVSLAAQNDSALLRVRDNGAGIAPDQIGMDFWLVHTGKSEPCSD
jgi:signal transduction histidine kinase